jgi:hypothetical protein
MSAGIGEPPPCGAMSDFDRRMLEILKERGVTVGSDGKFVRIPDFTGPNGMSDLRFMNERGPEYDTEEGLRRRWVENLADLVDELSTEGASTRWQSVALFWLVP